jgi:hypothetical protein
MPVSAVVVTSRLQFITTEGYPDTFDQIGYKRLKLGGGQIYDRSSDWTAVVAGATNNMA